VASVGDMGGDVLLLVVSRANNRRSIKLAVVVRWGGGSIVELLSGQHELSVDRRKSVSEREVVGRRSGEYCC